MRKNISLFLPYGRQHKDNRQHELGRTGSLSDNTGQGQK